MKKIIMTAIVLAMAVMLLIYPEECLRGAKNGLDVWFGSVLPSLLPFMAASFILLETGIVRLISHIFEPLTRFLFAAPGQSAYVFLASAFSGYPVGAKLAGELYKKGRISEHDAQKIVRFTSVSGPVFITGAVAAGMLGLAETGIYLAAAHYLSAILVGIIFGIFRRKEKSIRSDCVTLRQALQHFKNDIADCRPFGEILALSIEKALDTLLKIGGFIIFFSVITEILSACGIIDIVTILFSPINHIMPPESAKAMLYGGIEMATGCARSSPLPINLSQKLCIISFIIAFGGASIHMQTRAVCRACKLAPKNFFLAKSLQALFAYLLCGLFITLFPLSVSVSNIIIDTKTTAYCGAAFAAVSIIILFLIKLYQKKRKSILTFTRKL